MKKILSFFKDYPKLVAVLAIFVGSLSAEYIFKQQFVAQIIVSISGGVMALILLKEMIKTLRSGKYGVDILAITAIISTLLVGEYWASLMILLMLTGGESLEDYAAKKANSELKNLLDKSPKIAHVVNDEEIFDVGIEKVKIGQIILVKTGEIVPLDGEIVSGISDFDYSSMTGESAPITKKVGDEIVSGVVNGGSPVKLKVMNDSENSQFQQIIHLVKESEKNPANFVRMADRYAVPFTLFAYFISFAAWIISGDPVRFAQVLVVASPCPLILAAPVAIIAGMSRFSRAGLVAKSGSALEKIASAKTFAFDKTGTITKGVLNLSEIIPSGEFSKENLLKIVAEMEKNSSHVLAKSVQKYCNENNIQINQNRVKDLEEVIGFGLKAKVGMDEFKVGNYEFAGGDSDDKINKTTIFVSKKDKFIGKITFEDEIRPEANQVISNLRKNGIKQIMMLTGDNQYSAQEIAKLAGISENEVRPKLTPQGKIEMLQSVAKVNRPLIMVGDGVNDAPALAIADTGIAIGLNGSTAATDSADVVILRGGLDQITNALTISRETMNVAKQAVLIGIFICVVLMAIAAFGVIPALIGAALQEVVDVVSILWALKARK